ncbi:GNAT family N-acetyltransferase [Corallincola platygyrae]|uniref:GNAT family N-acetyltransferase n=1 Tax=Corallincola platygyrae TaxID=1193278 RepID=A0ABW4XQU5_9GAMM
MIYRATASDTTTGSAIDKDAIAALFKAVFSASEGETEGALIGGLAKDMFDKTPPDKLFNFVAEHKRQIVGSIFFSQLDFGDDSLAYILSPVAIHTDFQGQGIGQALIRYGLDVLKENGTEWVLTYGDPNFYCKVGFEPVSDKKIVPPVPLSYPHGWLGQSLTETAITNVSGACRCVEALSDPIYW